MGDPDVWPVLLDMSRDDCKRILRRLELEAYSNLVSVLRAQGSLTASKRRLLQSVAQALSISEERHKAECRRAVNSEKLATIAKHMGGANTGTEWAIEGRRLVPLLPRLVPQTAFTAIADKVANMAMTEGAKLPLPTPPVKKRLTSPSIDETLIEPNVPEASKTPHVPVASPLLLASPSIEVNAHLIQGKSVAPCSVQSSGTQPPSTQVLPQLPQLPVQLQHGSLEQPAPQNKLQAPLSSFVDQVKQEAVHGLVSQASPVPPISPKSSQLPSQTSQPQVVQPIPSQTQSQVVLLVQKEDRPQDERLTRKRPRSASLDASLNIQTHSPMMPPPIKKEALSPLSPPGTPTHLTQPAATISPQSHSQLVQQQTLHAAAVAAAAVSSPSPVPAAPSVQSQPSHQQQQSQLPPPQQQHQQQQQLPAQLQQLHQQQMSQQHQNQSCTTSQSNTTSATSRTITIPSQGVKLSLSSAMPSSGTGIPSGTHKVIIVSSTTPSILQRSLSVPVVKTLSTSAPSQPCTSALVLNTAQQSQQPACSANVGSGSSDTTASTSSHPASVTLPGKLQGKILSQSTPKARPRANSIVIPVTPNQANVLNTVAVQSMQLKSALQAGKQGILKPGDGTGLKIMPIASMGPNAKIMPKPPGSGPIYVVSSTSSASPTVSMVTRTVPSGARVMTFTSSLPKVAVSTSQGGTVLSMTSKPVQTLQLAQAGGVVTTSGSTSLSTTSGKPNVIVVQKGSAAFGRGVTLSHGGKEVVGKVLLGSKALTSLNPSQMQCSGQTAITSSLNLTSSNLQVTHAQSVPSLTSQPSITPQTSQSSLSGITSGSTRVVTVQKLPSAVVQGSGGSSNVIVLDLSQEQLNNSAVLNEILASSILQSSSTLTFNHDTVSEAKPTSVIPSKGPTFSSVQSDIGSGVLLNNDGIIMVEGFDHSVVQNVAEDSNIVDDFSASTESSQNFVVDDSSIDGGVLSSSRSTPQPSRCSDIFTTALSNANLNLNDFLDDNSLDGIQTSAEGMNIQQSTDADGNSNESNNGGDWVAGGSVHSPIDGSELTEV